MIASLKNFIGQDEYGKNIVKHKEDLSFVVYIINWQNTDQKSYFSLVSRTDSLLFVLISQNDSADDIGFGKADGNQSFFHEIF